MDKIYENTEWRDNTDGNGFRGMGFVIKKILVHQEWTTVASSQVRLFSTRLRTAYWSTVCALQILVHQGSRNDYGEELFKNIYIYISNKLFKKKMYIFNDYFPIFIILYIIIILKMVTGVLLHYI